jgi:hypothetical protein
VYVVVGMANPNVNKRLDNKPGLHMWVEMECKADIVDTDGSVIEPQGHHVIVECTALMSYYNTQPVNIHPNRNFSIIRCGNVSEYLTRETYQTSDSMYRDINNPPTPHHPNLQKCYNPNLSIMVDAWHMPPPVLDPSFVFDSVHAVIPNIIGVSSSRKLQIPYDDDTSFITTKLHPFQTGETVWAIE